jgi:hypothetical protein
MRSIVNALGALLAGPVIAMAVGAGVCIATATPARASDGLQVERVGVNLYSQHAPAMRALYHDNTPGVYAVTADGWGAGVYRNSVQRISVHADRTWQLIGPVSATLGVVSGYRRHWVAVDCAGAGRPELTDCHMWDTRSKTELRPFGTLSIAGPSLAGATPRLSWIPPIGGKNAQVLHLSAEWRL